MLSARVPDLDSLQLLLTVARTGSFGTAGRELGLTQQAVSARVRTIEKLVGVRVINRSTRGSTLTEAGALLADWATRVIDAAHELDVAMSALRTERDDHLDVAASYTVAEYLLPRWLARLRNELGPATGVNLVVRNSEQVAALVLDGAAALGFVEGPDVPAGLDMTAVGSDELVVVVPPGHPWTRRRRPITVEELAAVPLVTRERGSGTRQVLDDAFAAAAPGEHRAAPALELSATTAIRHAVLAGAGPAVLSLLAVGDDIAAGRLVRVRLHDLPLRRQLRGIWPEGPVPAGPARDLLRIATTRPVG
ncbi:MAG: LysR-family transcriptional regulator [Pseudonocardia sp.]|jgi:molybdate transport repressor ModE-like protein|nr:LysR-family transcriptional regulator [Pseudonocardia sp.]